MLRLRELLSSHLSTSLPITMMPDPKDAEMRRLMVDLWTNFATYHDPTPHDSGETYFCIFLYFLCDTIWSRALRPVSSCTEGSFIGYSLSGLDKKWEPATSTARRWVSLRDAKLVQGERDLATEERINFWRKLYQKVKF